MNVIAITIVCSILGTLIATLGLLRYLKKDTQTAASNLTRFEVKLDNVGKGVDEIRLDNKDQNRKIADLTEKVIRNEESTKSAHKRIDEIVKEPN